jgi:hypothetical protein
MAETEDYQQHDALIELKAGVAGYSRFRDQLAAQITPEEAIESEQLFAKGSLALGIALVALIGLAALEYIFKGYDSLSWHALYFDFINTIFLLSALLLRSWFRVPFAGRILMPLSTFFGFWEAVPDWHPYEMQDVTIPVLIYQILGLLTPFILGWWLDYGAASENDRSRPKLRRMVLVIFGLINIALWLGSSIMLKQPGFPLSITSDILVCFWGWWPGRWIARRLSIPSHDVNLVHYAAWWRWGRRACGRFLAVLFFAFPFFLFLNVLGTHNQLNWPLNDANQMQNQKFVTSYLGKNNVPTLWYWEMKGRWLEEADFTDPNSNLKIYGIGEKELSRAHEFKKSLKDLSTKDDVSVFFALALLDAQFGDDINKFNDFLGRLQFIQNNDNGSYLKLEDKQTFESLKTILAPYRINNTQQFNRLFPPNYFDDKEHQWNKIVVLESYKSREAIFSKGKELFFLQIGLNLHPLDKDRIELILHRYVYTAYLSLGVGLIGFIFVWRRGGESPTALWFGLILLFLSGSNLYNISNFSLPAFTHASWETALTSPTGSLLVSILALTSAGQILYGSNVIFEGFEYLPISLLWIYLCWPVYQANDAKAWRWLAGFTIRLLFIWGITALYIISIFLLNYILNNLHVGFDWNIAIGNDQYYDPLNFKYKLIVHVLFFALILLTGYWFRKRTYIKTEIRYLGYLPPVLFLVLLMTLDLICRLLSFTARNYSLSQELVFSGQQLFDWAFRLGMFALVGFTLILIRRNFLRVLSTKGVALLLLSVFVPVGFEIGENLASNFLQKTTFFSEDGAQLLGLLATVLLLARCGRKLTVLSKSP